MTIIDHEIERMSNSNNEYTLNVRLPELKKARLMYEKLARGESITVSISGNDFSDSDDVYIINTLEEFVQCALVHPGILIEDDDKVAFVDWW